MQYCDSWREAVFFRASQWEKASSSSYNNCLKRWISWLIDGRLPTRRYLPVSPVVASRNFHLSDDHAKCRRASGIVGAHRSSVLCSRYNPARSCTSLRHLQSAIQAAKQLLLSHLRGIILLLVFLWATAFPDRLRLQHHFPRFARCREEFRGARMDAGDGDAHCRNCQSELMNIYCSQMTVKGLFIEQHQSEPMIMLQMLHFALFFSRCGELHTSVFTALNRMIAILLPSRYDQAFFVRSN